MAFFCENCGKPLQQNGYCTNCGKWTTLPGITYTEQQTPRPADFPVQTPPAPAAINSPAQKTKEPRKEKKKKRFLPALLAILLVLLLSAVGICTLVYYDKIDIPTVNRVLIALKIKEDKDTGTDADGTTDELAVPYSVPYEDAEAYLSQRGTVTSTQNASDSSSVQTEADAIAFLNARGFPDLTVTADFSSDGTYSPQAASANDTEKHPSYTASYITADGEIWSITVTNGCIMAMPLRYNADKGVAVILTENGKVISYDNQTNTFFTIIPESSLLQIKTVTNITAELLESLTEGGIDAL